MDLARYLSLLTKASLFFARADILGDPCEGSWPARNAAGRVPFFRYMIPDGDPKEIATNYSDYNKKIREFTYVNCWHTNDHESLAMWRMYAPQGAGIAIKSNHWKLAESLHMAEDSVYVGAVKYLDFETEVGSEWSPLAPYITKRKSFEHEHELRAIIQRRIPEKYKSSWKKAPTPKATVIPVPVDLNVLILAVHVAPESPHWIQPMLADLSAQYGLKAPVIQSSMDREPVF